MKLDKVEVVQQKKNKKIMIIAVSILSVLMLSGIAGWFILRNGENDITEFAQRMVSGRNTKKTLDEKEDEFVLDPPTVRSLQSLLSKTGFGYASGVYDYKYDKNKQELIDKSSVSTSKGEDLYIMCNQDEKYSYQTYKYDDAWDLLKDYMKDFWTGSKELYKPKEAKRRCKRKTKICRGSR